jgi:ribonuclease P protein component
MEKSYSFKKDERLKGKKAIATLFDKGNSFYCYPFRVLWMPLAHQGSYPVQTAVSVSKKYFKKAIDRNRIKRLMREAWRLNKISIYNTLEEHKGKIILMILYTGTRLPSYRLVLDSMEEVVSKLSLLLHDAANIEKPAEEL